MRRPVDGLALAVVSCMCVRILLPLVFVGCAVPEMVTVDMQTSEPGVDAAPADTIAADRPNRADVITLPLDRLPDVRLPDAVEPAGRLLLFDSFDDPSTLGRIWRVGKGTWRVDAGSLEGAAIAAEHHAAGVAHAIRTREITVQLRFQFNGANQVAICYDTVLAGMPEHVGCVWVTRRSIRIERATGYGPTTMSQLLDSRTISLQQGQWYTLVQEIVGTTMVARLDNGVEIRGSAPGLDAEKSLLKLHIGGETARFDDIKVWIRP